MFLSTSSVVNRSCNCEKAFNFVVTSFFDAFFNACFNSPLSYDIYFY